MSRPETSDGLENITVDPSGGLLVSDPLTLARRNLDALIVAELILQEDRPLSAVLQPRDATASEREWSAHGWARSLDYFLWSEGGRSARRTRYDRRRPGCRRVVEGAVRSLSLAARRRPELALRSRVATVSALIHRHRPDVLARRGESERVPSGWSVAGAL